MASPLFFPRFRALDANGAPLAGGKVYTYAPGTTTAKATYTTAALSTANANPVILDANGEANIFTADGETYKITLHSSTDVLQWTLDNVTFGSTSTTSAVGGAAPNFIDNGGCEVLGFAGGGADGSATGAGAESFVARWWGYRSGATGYTITPQSGNGFPRYISMKRDSGNTNTTSLMVGQHTGYLSGVTNVFDIINSALNPSLTGYTAQTVVLSAYLAKGANFSGTGATIELLSNTSSTNICSGAGWTVEASATLTAAQLSTTAWTRLSVAKTGAFTASSLVLGIRIKFNAPAGTAGAADTLLVTGVKLELGYSSSPTTYTIPPTYEALARARRFRQRLPAQTTSGYGAAGANNDYPIFFEAQMASVPTVTVEGTWAVTNCSQPTVVNVTVYGATMRLVSTALGAFSAAGNSADDVLLFDCETP